jgi:peptidyl-prolyl cis-trans isomerase C
MPRRPTLALLALLAGPLALPLPAAAQEKVVATVNGKAITEADLRHVEAEIGSELANIPPESRRQVMVEFLVQNELFATAAEADKLGQGAAFDSKVQYYRRRALRDAYFERRVREAVTDAEARKFYEGQAAQMKDNPQVRARHILVKEEREAREVHQQVVHGGDFAKLAMKHSKDPGSAANGGDLGFMQRGQTVKAFDETIFKLKPGEVSEPVKTEFGWHIIRVEERRALPPYEGLKERIMAQLIQEKAQALSEDLRKKARIEYVDPALKKAVEAQAQGAAGAAAVPAQRR